MNVRGRQVPEGGELPQGLCRRKHRREFERPRPRATAPNLSTGTTSLYGTGLNFSSVLPRLSRPAGRGSVLQNAGRYSERLSPWARATSMRHRGTVVGPESDTDLVQGSGSNSAIH